MSFTKIITQEILDYKEQGRPVPLTSTIQYFKSKGIRMNKETLKLRCKFLGAEYD